MCASAVQGRRFVEHITSLMLLVTGCNTTPADEYAEANATEESADAEVVDIFGIDAVRLSASASTVGSAQRTRIETAPRCSRSQAGRGFRTHNFRNMPDTHDLFDQLLYRFVQLHIWRTGLDIRKLSPEQRHRLMQMLTGSARSIIERWFESPMVRSMYASDCFSGNFASLDQPGSAIPFFHMAIGELDSEPGAWGLVKGGMGGITQAMASFARSNGVQIRTDATVEKIRIEHGRSIGVCLSDGELLNSRCVLANTDPKRTFLNLVDRDDLDEVFARDIEHLRMGHASMKVNLALSSLPDIRFPELRDGGLWSRSDIAMFPDIEGLEENYAAAAAGRLPREPRLEITIPSTVDDSLAPPGSHVMSVLAKYYPYKLAGGLHWDDIKEDVADRIVAYMARAMPNLEEVIVARQTISPLDLETIYGLTESDIFHGRHDLDQLFSFRPHPRAAQYRTPIQNLYLCGSGSHPGGVTGAPGHNAARRVISDLRKQ